MIGRLRLLLLLLMVLALAPFASARVLSYAPYTNRTAQSSYHHRGGRWFTLVETSPGQPALGSQVVLYDARGLEEPRVIYPAGTDSRFIYFTAVYEPKDAPPHILISTYEYAPAFEASYYLSLDGGKSFNRVQGLNGNIAVNLFDPDFGGPYSHGLTSNVLVGGLNSFVIGATNGIFAIDHAGNAKMLAPSSYRLLGRDREGGQFLIGDAQNVVIVDAGGGLRTIGAQPGGYVLNGWITSDGSAYVQTSYGPHRYLWLYRNGQKTLAGGTADVEPGSATPVPVPFSSTFFAVPTTDYNGAWMVQRQSGKPTTLLRHTIAAGKETMWSDVSGPQVEALHTGLTKADTLLIQVHRPRAVEERIFLDPALAVWRVGEPAPRGYDELFMNETDTKGFTHLDVDTIAGGSPFVFDSGLPQGAILLSPPTGSVGGGGGADVMQEWGVVRASLKQRLVLPGVARQGGAFGSFWLTDVVIHNPLAQSQDVSVRFSPIGGDVQAAVIHQKTLTLAAHEIRVVKDVMKSLFSLEQGGGVLYLEPTSAVTATARTYTRSGEGSFGFGMQAIDAMNAAGPRFPLTFAGAFPGSAFRTNMLLTDTSGRGTEGRLQAHGLSGVIGADDIALSAPANSAQQLNGLAGSLGLIASDAGGLEIHPLRGSLIATVVAMDNRTNDPTFFPPDLSAPVVRTIPAIGHLDGANGSKFRSDLYLLNPSSHPRTVTLQAKKWDSTESANRPFTLLPGEARVIPDALFTLFGYTGVARLRYSSMDGFGADGVRVTSRTYNVDQNGGTYGCLVPPLNGFQSAGPGEKLEILGIVGGSGFRTNVGFVDLTPNPGSQTAEARVHIVDDAGKELDQFALAFPLAGGTQINDIFNARGIAQPAAAIVYVEVVRGLVAAYATLTDNVTNDSTYLGASLSAQPD